jgi:hypothetical protein
VRHVQLRIGPNRADVYVREAAPTNYRRNTREQVMAADSLYTYFRLFYCTVFCLRRVLFRPRLGPGLRPGAIPRGLGKNDSIPPVLKCGFTLIFEVEVQNPGLRPLR